MAINNKKASQKRLFYCTYKRYICVVLKQLYSRYKQFPALKQLLILYAINWIWWFIAYMIGERIFLEEQHSILYHLFDATFTALLWTLLWNYASFKMLFSKKTEKH